MRQRYGWPSLPLRIHCRVGRSATYIDCARQCIDDPADQPHLLLQFDAFVNLELHADKEAQDAIAVVYGLKSQQVVECCAVTAVVDYLDATADAMLEFGVQLLYSGQVRLRSLEKPTITTKCLGTRIAGCCTEMLIDIDERIPYGQRR